MNRFLMEIMTIYSLLIFFEDPNPLMKFSAVIKFPSFEIAPSKFLPNAKVSFVLVPTSYSTFLLMALFTLFQRGMNGKKVSLISI